jgi:ATP dependent DNA ligase-like protein
MNLKVFKIAKSVGKIFFNSSHLIGIDTVDGERIQVHKGIDGRVELFSRRLEKVTHHYPDIVKLTINASSLTRC